jgi:alpha-beta hydrolase superfamily lysophospholipase
MFRTTKHLASHSNLILYCLVLLATGCATPYVHPPSSPASAPSLSETHAIMDDGYRLPLKRWDARTSPGAIVLAVHGLNDYSNSFAGTGDFLAARGITVVAYDQRGFGGTAGHGYWHGSERLVADVRTVASLIRASYPDTPLYLLGESMGGAVVLSALRPDPPDIAGIILIAPAVWSRDTMPLYQRLALWVAAHTVPARRLTGEGLDLKPSDNIPMLRALGRDPLVIKATRVDVLYGVSNLMDNATAGSSELSSDTLILYGKKDEIIPKQPTCQWLEGLPETGIRPWRAIFYDDGYHMLTRDLHADAVLEDIADWLLGENEQGNLPPRSGQSESLASFCTS